MEILPFLFLGSAYHASKKDMLDGMGISALLNVSSSCPNHFEGIYTYKCIPVEDNHKADISSWFIEAIDYIGGWRSVSGGLPPGGLLCLVLMRLIIFQDEQHTCPEVNAQLFTGSLSLTWTLYPRHGAWNPGIIFVVDNKFSS